METLETFLFHANSNQLMGPGSINFPVDEFPWPPAGSPFAPRYVWGHSNRDWTAPRLGIALAAEELNSRLAPFDDYPAGAKAQLPAVAHGKHQYR